MAERTFFKYPAFSNTRPLAAIILRSSLLTITTVFWATLSLGQNPKERAFVAAVREVIANLSNRDSISLSKLVDKRFGVYVLYVVGTKSTYKRYTTIGFCDSTYPNAPFYDKLKYTLVKYGSSPTYSCATEK